MVTPRSPSKFGPFTLGVNNREADTKLDTRAGSYLREGVNVDITSAGRIKRRQGFSSVLSGTNTHSLYSNGKRAFFVDGNTLYEMKVEGDAIEREELRTGIAPHARLSYCDLGDDILFTGNGENRRITASGSKPLAVPKPNPAPVATAEGSGYFMTPGLYQVCAVYAAADGTFSGSTEPMQVQVNAGQAMRILGLDRPFPENVASALIFMTPPDGDTFMLLAVLTAPADPADGVFVTADVDLGMVCPTFMLDALPAGQIIRRTNGGGRVLVASGNILFISNPFQPGLYDRLKGYIPFESEITLVESGHGGTYVATESKTYRLADDFTSELETVLPYGVVRGTSGMSPDRKVLWWMGTRGLVRVGQGDPRDTDNLLPSGGEVITNLQEDAIAMRDFAEGASLFREVDGMKQVISSLRGPESTGAAAYSYFDAEVIRKGTVL